MKSKTIVPAAFVAFTLTGLAPAATVIYSDDFNNQQNIDKGGSYTQTLAGSTTTVGGGTWLASVEAGGWGQRNWDGTSGVATPTSSNFLAFTPVSGLTYTVQMTIDTTGIGGAGSIGVPYWPYTVSTDSWFTVGFTGTQHHWNGSDAATIDTGHLVRWNSNSVTTITYTVSGADLVTAGVHYVGWITDYAGAVNLTPSNQQVKIDNFSLTAVPEPNAALLGGLGMLALLRRRR